MPSLGRLYLLFTPTACRLDPFATLTAALDGGVDLVQWRSKEIDLDGFRRCRDLCRNRSVPLLVNDDVMLALRSHIAGAHVGQTDMPADVARKLLVDGWLGVSTHSPEQIAAAAHSGATYVGFGPCFPTATKGYTTGKTSAEIEAAIEKAAALRLPLFAIGGITPANLVPLRVLGIDRIAVSSAILQADDPGAAAAALRRLL
jgi:thiamine-phosphate pyrophosphorylase